MTNMRPILRLLTGPAGTGKTSRCIELFRDRVLRSGGSGLNSSCYFVLPNKEHTDRIHDLITRDPRVAGLVQHHLLPIGDFIRFKCWTGRDRVVTQFERRWLAGRVLESGSWGWMDRSARTAGMAECLANWLGEFKSAGVNAEQFEASGGILIQAGSDAEKVRDLAAFYRAYEDLKRAEGYRDPEEAIDEFARESRTAGAADMDLVILDGFFSLTERQVLFLEAVTHRAKEVVVTLTLPDGSDRSSPFLYPLRLWEKLSALGFTEERLADAPRRFKNADLAALERGLFASGEDSRVARPAAATGVRSIEAATRRQEVEAIARSAIQNVRSGRCHWSDQMVVFRSVAAYQPYVEEVLGSMGVPYEFHERRRLSEHPAVRRMIEWLELVEDPSIIRVHRWALWVDSPAVLRQLDALPARLDWAQEQVPQNLSGLDAAGESVWKCERGRMQRFLELDNSRELKKFLEELFDDCAGGQVLAATRRAGDLVRELIERQTVRPAAAAAAGREGVRAATVRFRGDLEAGLYSVASRQRNRVQVYDTALALPKEYRIVYVGGLNQGEFPVLHREDPVLSDAERKALAGAGIVLDTAGDRRRGEAFFFYMAVTRASEEVVLTRFTADDEGRPVSASDWWHAARAVFSNEIPCERLGPDDLVPAAARLRTPKDLVTALGRSLAPDSGHAEEARVLGSAWDRIGEAERAAVGCRELSAGLAVRRIRISHATSAHLDSEKPQTAKKKPWSATEAQTIRQCRFLYFAKYGVGIKPPIETTPVMREGEIWHKALEILMKKWFGGSRKLPLLKEFLDSAGPALAEALREHPPVAERYYLQSARLERIRRRWPRVVEAEWNNLKSTRTLVPAHFEAAFGLFENGIASEKAAFAVEAGGERLEFQGKIDRIDTDPATGRALAADYKSGKGFAPAELRKGMRFQAVLYALALEKVWGYRPIGTEYVSLRNFKRGGLLREDFFREERPQTRLKSLMPPEEFASFIQGELEALASDWQRYRSGDIAADPKSCQYCDYYPLCRYEKHRDKK